MNNYTKESDRERHERIFNQPTQERAIKPKLYSRVTNFFQNTLKSFTASNDLRVWQTSDRFGNKVWHAYDPVTGRYTSVESEAEIRAWIEKRYYQ